MPNTNNQNSSYSKSKDSGPTPSAFTDLGAANVRFGVLKKDEFLANVSNNGLYFIFGAILWQGGWDKNFDAYPFPLIFWYPFPKNFLLPL